MNINQLKIGAAVAALFGGTLALDPAVDAYHSPLPCPAADGVPVCEILRERSEPNGSGDRPTHRPPDITATGDDDDAGNPGQLRNGCLHVPRTRLTACPD